MQGKHWYALYTYPRHEKIVAEGLQLRGFENFLPLYKAVHKWRNGVTMHLDLPLFPGYVFVNFNLGDRYRILDLGGVSKIVGFAGRPTALPDSEIEIIRSGLVAIRSEPHPFLKIGERVLIKRGPLSGLEGVLLQKKKDHCRVVISVDLIMRSIAVEISASDVEPIKPAGLKKASAGNCLPAAAN